MRDLVERPVLHPKEERGGLDLEIQGHLAGLFRFATGQPARSAVVLNRGVSLAERGGREAIRTPNDFNRLVSRTLAYPRRYPRASACVISAPFLPRIALP